MSLFDKAIEQKENLNEVRKIRNTIIDNFCVKEHENRKSKEYKELKRKVKQYAKLMDKVQETSENGNEDPIALAFAKVNDIVALLRDMGRMKMLNEYLNGMSELKAEVKDKEARVSGSVDELDEKLKNNWDDQVEIKKDLDGLKEQAEEEGLCSKTRFNKLVKIVQDYNNGKEDVEDKIQEEFLLSGLVSKGAEAVAGIVKPKETD